MTTLEYSLDEFVHDMKDLLKSDPGKWDNC